MNNLYAFWKYSWCSYTGIKGVLGGEILTMDDNGRVEIKSYGRGNGFQPVHIVPVKSGKELMEKLKVLQQEYEAEHKKIDKKYQAELYKLCPWLKESK